MLLPSSNMPILTNLGKAALLRRIVDDSILPFVYIGVGQGEAPLSSDDDRLDKEILSDGFQRKAAEIKIKQDEKGNDVIVFSAVFSGAKNVVITEVGLFNSNSGGVMLVRDIVGQFGMRAGTEYECRFRLDLKDVVRE